VHRLARFGLLVLLAGTADAADPPLVVFHHAAEAPPEVTAMRQALSEVARAERTTLLDLSPRLPPPAAAAAALRRAVEAWEAFRYHEALEAVTAAAAEASATGGQGLSPSELSDVFLYRALLHAQGGDTVRAWDDFVRAATVDPARRLDPLRFPPRTVETFQRAVTQVQAAPRGSLVVPDLPDSCHIAVDGRALAGREASSLPLGEHYLRIECPTAAPFATVVVVSQALQSVRAELRPWAIPDDGEVLALARARGARAVVYVRAHGTEPGSTVSLRLLGARPAQVFAAPTEAPAALRSLIAGVVRPRRLPLVPTVPAAAPRPPPWYASPWLWAGVGAALTAAVLLPLTLDREPASGARIVVEGDVP
jgi:hypothetical protein